MFFVQGNVLKFLPVVITHTAKDAADRDYVGGKMLVFMQFILLRFLNIFSAIIRNNAGSRFR